MENLHLGLNLLALFAVLSACVVPLGYFIALVLEGRTGQWPFWRRLEHGLFRLLGLQSPSVMGSKSYLLNLLLFNLVGWVVLYAILIFQDRLPWNPNHLPAIGPFLALEIASSFVTNTNWQSYAGEVTLSHFSQVVGLGVQNFLSPAVGLAVLAALIRGIRAKADEGLGNFYVDVLRVTFYILAPLSLIWAGLLLTQGVPANFKSDQIITSVEGKTQTIPQGPVAPLEAIKMLGTNGGGYFGQNAAHPLENPTPLSNFLELIAILLIPTALCFTYGRMIRKKSEGWMLLGVFSVFLVVVLSVSLYSEHLQNSFLGTAQNWEGKEWRFGLDNSVIWSVFTTLTSSGSVNAMHSSLTPLSGGLALLNMLLGEVIFGGIGSGIYGLFLFLLFTVFLGGLMVGRSPVYMGKKIEAFDMKMAVLGMMAPNLLILLGAVFLLLLPGGRSVLSTQGPHGLSELIYTFASATNNNGSAFAGINAGVPWLQVVLSAVMLIGRFVGIIIVLMLAGSFVKKKPAAEANFFTTQSFLFAGLLLFVVFIFSILTFFPVLSLGPLLEHFLFLAGQAG